MKVDIAPYIPKQISGFDVIVNEDLYGEPSILMDYNQNRVKPIRIKRFVDSKVLGGFLGQYQAEGTKNDKKKNRLEFSNKLIQEHIEHIKGLEEWGFTKKQIVIHASFREDYDGTEISKQFERETNFKINCSYISKGQKGKYGFKTKVQSTIANRVIISTLDSLRNDLANNSFDKMDEKFRDAFLAKLLTGDGTLDIRTKNREFEFPYSRIKIVDKEVNYLEDYAKILNNLGFISHIQEERITVKAGCSLEKLFYLYQIEAFRNTPNWDKLILVLGLSMNGRRNNTYYRFLDFAQINSFTSLDIVNNYNVCLRVANGWLKNKEKEGLIKGFKKVHNYSIWSLTESGKEFSNLLLKWKTDYDILIKKHNNEEPLKILEKIKVKNKKKSVTTSQLAK